MPATPKFPRARRRRLGHQRLENRHLLTATVLDFEELELTDAMEVTSHGAAYAEYAHGGYELSSTASDSAVEMSGRWRVAQPGSYRYTGSNALSSVWAPVTITLARSDGESFSIDSIDLYPWLPVYEPSVTFTAELASGGMVSQSFDLIGSELQTYQFSDDFAGILALNWRFTGFDDYHTFDNLVLQDDTPTPIPIDVDDTIDLKRDKLIRVALLSSETFEPSSVDLESLELTVNGIALDIATHRRGFIKFTLDDVNGDGISDVVVGFRFDSSQFEPGEYTASLTGTADGSLLVGLDEGLIAAKTKGPANGKR